MAIVKLNQSIQPTQEAVKAKKWVNVQFLLANNGKKTWVTRMGFPLDSECGENQFMKQVMDKTMSRLSGLVEERLNPGESMEFDVEGMSGIRLQILYVDSNKAEACEEEEDLVSFL